MSYQSQKIIRILVWTSLMSFPAYFVCRYFYCQYMSTNQITNHSIWISASLTPTLKNPSNIQVFIKKYIYLGSSLLGAIYKLISFSSSYWSGDFIMLSLHEEFCNQIMHVIVKDAHNKYIHIHTHIFCALLFSSNK